MIQDHPIYEGPQALQPSLGMPSAPGYAPGVSHREAGGLTPGEVLTLLQSIDGEVVGADLVEYNPLRDLDGMTSEVGAKLMKELLGLLL